MSNENEIETTESQNSKRKSLALALALVVSMPLAAGESKDTAESVEEKQYSMEAEGENPKTSDGEDASYDKTGDTEVEEKQYSMQDGDESPKTAYESAIGDSGDTHSSSDMSGAADSEKQYSMSDETESPISSDTSEEHQSQERSHESMMSARDATQYDVASQGAEQPTAQLNKWKGIALHSSDSVKAGEVEDVIVNLKTGKATHVLIDNPGLMSGETIVPISKISATSDEGVADIQLSAAEIEALPNFEGISEETGSEDYFGDDSHTLSSQHALCSDLIDEDIELRDGADLGDVKGIMQIPGSSDVYVIVDDLKSDNVDKFEADQIAIKLSLLERQPYDDDLTANIDMFSIDQSPEVIGDDPDSWRMYNGRDTLIIGSGDDSYATTL